MSHEALGIKGSPIPITVENTEEKTRKFLAKPRRQYSLRDLKEE